MTRRTVLLALALPAVLPAVEGFAIITQKNNPNTITKGQLKKLMLGDTANWQGGGKITLFLAPAGEPSRVAAIKQSTGMSESDYNKNLIHLGFIGQADGAPRTLPSTITVRLAVQVNVGSIGIIPVSEVNDAVKKLDID